MSAKWKKGFTYGAYIVNAALIVLSVLAVIKSVFVGFDIDEGYAVAQAYRLVKGDRLFMDMWEPHQMSAYAAAVCMIPFLLCTGGSTTGVVIYLRILGTLIHLLLAYGFYKEASKRFHKTSGLLIALVHVNFLSKWIVLPEFEIMQYWAACIVFLALLAWTQKPQKRYLIIAGTAFFSMLFTYPTMILLYPVYVFAVVRIKKDSCKKRLEALVYFTLPSLALGIIFLLYLFSYMTVSEFAESIGYIFMDKSHSVSLGKRGILYAGEIKQWCLRIWDMLPVVIGVMIAAVGIQLMGEKKNTRLKEKRISALVLAFCLSLTGIFCIEHIWESLTMDKNQFHLYLRFFLISVTGIVGAFLSKKSRVYVWSGIVPGMVGILASLLITNMSLEIAAARAYIGVMASCFVLASLLQEKYQDNLLLKAMCYGNVLLFLGGLFICKLIMVRVTGCIPVTVRMHMDLVTEGPAAGLLVGEELAEQYNENIPVIKAYAEAGDNLLYFGCEHIYYMVSEAEIATPSVQGTAVFNEMYTTYFEVHPERFPNVVVIDKSFQTNPYYMYQLYAKEHQYMLDWIENRFRSEKVCETENLILYKIEK